MIVPVLRATGRLAIAAALVLGVLVALVPAGPAHASDPAPGSQPQVFVPDNEFAVGDEITVRGSGWPAGDTVSITTCGNLAANLSADCDQSSQAMAPVGDDGAFGTAVVIGRPPTTCPCLLRVISQREGVESGVIITIEGIAEGEVQQDDFTRALEAELDVEGSGPFTAYLGGPAERTFVLTVRNTGAVPLQDPELTVFAGNGDTPTDVIARPEIGLIEPGHTVTYRQKFTLGWADVGSTTVRAQFTDVSPIVDVTGTTMSIPWLLILIALLLLQIPLLGLYKKRPVVIEPDDDPVLGGGPAPVRPVPAGVATAVPVAAGPLAQRPDRTVDPDYRPVFGVSDLHTYLEPSEPVPARVVAPQVVVGGVQAPQDGPVGVPE